MNRLPPMPSLSTVGVCMLLYGPTGCGKTHCVITAEGKVLFINREPKDARQIHLENDPTSVDRIEYARSTGFEDDIATFATLLEIYKGGQRPYDCIFDDGLTFNMTDYKQTIEDDRYQARILAGEKDKKDAPRPGVVDRFRIERNDWGTIADMMARKTYLFNQISEYGVLCVSTAIDTEYPKWNSTIKVAPALVGQEFPKLVHGYFGFIGYVVNPYHIESGQIVEPRVSFVSPGDGTGNSYMARCNSARLTQAHLKYGNPRLNLARIMQVIRGQVDI